MSAAAVELTVLSPQGRACFKLPTDISVRTALDYTELRVRAACEGNGQCGACRVQWLAGACNAPTAAELLKLTHTELNHGVRLACQLYAQGPLTLRIAQPARHSIWKSLPPDPTDTLACTDFTAAAPYGLAVDVGTTHLRVALWQVRTGQCIGRRVGLNPQAALGSDVLRRLAAAEQRGAELATLARDGILAGLRDILIRDVGEIHGVLTQLGRVVVVGNTAMLALLSERGAAELQTPDYWQTAIDCQPAQIEVWSRAWGLPHANIELIAPLAGFIGSDLIADVLATRLLSAAAPALLADFGTNIEIALWDGQTLWVTAVPGGPAFEGVGIRYGMAADPGAIDRLEADGEGVRYHVIGAGEPLGWCGSGLIDALAWLCDRGRLKPSGRFALETERQGALIDPNQQTTLISAADVDALQRAKGATAAAMEQLLTLAGLSGTALQRLCLCGAFGHDLNIAAAQRIGLLPMLPPERIELHADSALCGAEALLLNPQADIEHMQIVHRAKVINLSYLADYEDRFIRRLRLAPLEVP